MEEPTKRPEFIRQFSKEEYQTERDQKAQEIRALRSDYFDQKAHKTKIEAERAKMQQEISNLSQNGLAKVLNYFQLRDLQQRLGQNEEELEEVISQEIDLQEAKRLVDDFYLEINQHWQEEPYDRETIERYFNEEYLAKLNLDQYGLLLSRFKREIATHVTRQGIRDHASRDHIAGLGEYHANFKELLAHGHFLSPLATQISKYGLEQTIYRKLSEIIEDEDNERYGQTKRQRLLDFFGHISSPSIGWGTYAAPAAIHFAYNEVLDEIY